MELKQTKQALQVFAKNVVKFSRSNLTRQKKNVNKKLYDSIKYDLKVHKNSFSLLFEMEDYGVFQDKGVKGKDPSKVSPNAKITGQQAPNSKYKFGSGKTGNYKGFVLSIEKWAKKKNVRLRDKKGKFTKGNYKTIAHIIAGNIYNRGIKPSLFFTKPFEASFKNLPKELTDKFGLDLENIITE